MKWPATVVINLMVLALIFGILEFATRALAPQYANAYFTQDVTGGHFQYRNHHWGHRVAADQVGAALQRKDPTEQRILFVGDSVTLGFGVRYEDTYHEIAWRALSQKECNAFVHGVGRYNSNLDELFNSEYRDFVLHGFDANYVIYQFNVNDVPIGLEPERADRESLTLRQQFEKFRISYLNRSALLKAVQSITRRSYQRSRPQNLLESLYYSGRSDPELYKHGWEQFAQSLRRNKRALHSLGIGFAVILVPESYQISTLEVDNDLGMIVSDVKEWPSEIAARIAQTEGIPVFDVAPALQQFRREHQTTALYFPNDPNHPNETGQRVIGEAVAQYLLGLPGICVK